MTGTINAERRHRASAIFLVAAAILLLAFVGICRSTGFSLVSAIAAQDEPTKQIPIVDASAPEYHFYYFDEGKQGPYNFGTSAPTDDAQAADAEFRKRLGEDPALLAAIANYLDHELKLEGDDRILRKEQGTLVGATSNKALENMMADEAYRQEVLEKTLKNLDLAGPDGMEISPITKYGSWMYMSDVDDNGVPEIIIRDANALPVRDGGTELIYTITFGDDEYKLHIRLECGFQPIGIYWWEPPTKNPPPETTPRHTTTPPPTTTVTVTTGPDTTTTTEKVFKRIEDVVTDATGCAPNNQVDLTPSSTIAEESRYTPPEKSSSTAGKSTTTTTAAKEVATGQSQNTTQGSKPAAETKSGTRPSEAIEDKIVENSTVSIEPEPVTVPADDYVAPQEPALKDVGVVTGEIEIPN